MNSCSEEKVVLCPYFPFYVSFKTSLENVKFYNQIYQLVINYVYNKVNLAEKPLDRI